MDWINDNYVWITAVAVPAIAPIITIMVNKYGSPKVKAVWAVVRKIYRLGVGMKNSKGSQK